MPVQCPKCEGTGIVTRINLMKGLTARERCPKCNGKKFALTDEESNGVEISVVKAQTVFLRKMVDGAHVATLELRVMPLMIGGKPAINGEDQMLFDVEIPRMNTQPQHRGRGYMNALLTIAQDYALHPGIVARMRTCISDSTEQGKTFLRHHGFVERGDQLIWERGAV